VSYARPALNSPGASPLSNLKLLTDVACAEFGCDIESRIYPSIRSDDENCSPPEASSSDDSFLNDSNGAINLENSEIMDNSGPLPKRGEKLAEICSRFMQRLPLEPLPKDQRPVLDMGMMEKMLGVERRRLYDILNILESLSIVEKVRK
jgi:hypothetical protein